VSFQIDLNYFAWTKICYLPDEKLAGKLFVDEWHCHKLDQYFDKKPNLSSMSSLLVQLADEIPQADAYVIEGMPMVNTTQGGAAQIFVNIHKVQFYAMLCALMSCRKSIKALDANAEKNYFPNMYFLKSFLPSRFYKYLIGSEKVATEQVVDFIFDYNAKVNHREEMPKLESVDIPKDLIDYFHESMPVEKEYLGNSLLIGLTFMKLCVQKCPKCISTLKVRNRP
jgi:transcription elongation factor